MGEEYGETAPFPYFVSHSEPELIEAVRKGRQEEFASFQWQDDLPDPQDKTTFVQAKLNHELKSKGQHHVLMKFYKEAAVRMKKAEHTTADAEIGFQNQILIGNFVNRERPSLLEAMDDSYKKKLGEKYVQWPVPA